MSACRWPQKVAHPSKVHLVLERPRALVVPVPCRGALGLWTPYVATVHHKLEYDGVVEVGVFPTVAAAKAKCLDRIRMPITWSEFDGGIEGNGIYPEVFTICPWEPPAVESV